MKLVISTIIALVFVSSSGLLCSALPKTSKPYTSIKRPEIRNPLQKVNVRQTRVEQNDEITVAVDRYVQTEKVEWFNVSWSGVNEPAYDDWIAVMAPANASMAEVAPVKWRLAVETDDHILYGNGTLRFRMISYRTDVSFVFVRNGFTKPVVVARSPPLRLAQPNLPLQGHLALTGKNSEMLVQWNTRDAPTRPEVRWGLAPGQYSASAVGRSFTYGREDMCGAQEGSRAANEGWMDPGVQSVAVMTDLLPGRRYYYIYGDESLGFSAESSFLSAPPVGPDTTVRLLAIADMGQGELDGSMQGWQMAPSLTTTALLERDLSNSLARERAANRGGGRSRGGASGGGRQIGGGDRRDASVQGSAQRGGRASGFFTGLLHQSSSSSPSDTNSSSPPSSSSVSSPSSSSLSSSSSSSSPAYSSSASVAPSALSAGNHPDLIPVADPGPVSESGYSLLIHNGDICYAQGFSSQWDNFFHQIEPLVSRMPYMVAPGNHERDWPGSGDRYAVTDSGGECGVPYEQRMTMPIPGRDQQWYSFDYGPIHFLQMSTEHEFLSGSPQYDFIVRDLVAVNRSRTPWLVVGAHRPIYINSNDEGIPSSDQVVSQQLRDTYEALFMDHRVDVTLSGHHHSYQRTCPVYRGECLGFDAKDGSARAPIHFVIGNAGAGLCFNVVYPYPSWIEKLEVWWGYLRVEASGTRLSLEAISNYEGEIIERVELVKPRV